MNREDIIRDVRNFARHLQVYSPTVYVNFEPRDYQDGLLKRYQQNNHTIVKHTRQCGATLTSGVYMLWHALTKSNQNIVITSYNLRVGLSLLLDVLDLYSSFSLKDNFISRISYSNKNEIEFSNGSKITVISADEYNFAGMRVDLLYIENCEFMPEPILRKMIPIINTSGKSIMASSPRPGNTIFNTMFSEAEDGVSRFKPFNIKGFKVPGRNKYWMERMKADLGVAEFKLVYNWH